MATADNKCGVRHEEQDKSRENGESVHDPPMVKLLAQAVNSSDRGHSPGGDACGPAAVH